MKKAEILNFGSYIRTLREEEGVPLRKIAAQLDIDPSTLGKIEKNSRNPNLKQIEQLAGIFSVEASELHARYLSDQIAAELKPLRYKDKILEMTKQKLYQKR